jgi:DNA-binding Xre family transcriptional regulator
MTKLNKLLIEMEVSQADLYREIARIYPKSPITKPQLSRIINGRVEYYSTFTVIRICAALKVTPNEILEY